MIRSPANLELEQFHSARTSDGEMAWVSKEGHIGGEVARFGGAIDAIDMTEEGAQAIWRLAFRPG